jgi:FkbM family methyltransferase
MGTATRATHQARRIWQTPLTFKNWVPILADMALEKAGRGPDTLVFKTRTGLTIECPNRPGARVPIYEIFAEDCYHFEWFLGPLMRRPIDVINVGGQIGTFDCRLAQLHPHARISSYEPSRFSAAILRRNLERNGFADRVEVMQAALAATIGMAEFDDNEGGSGQNSLVSGARGSVATTTVKTTTFDAAVAAPSGPFDVVKIDCEGGEYDLVLASSPASWASVQRVVIEFHPVDGHSWDELGHFFKEVGLSVQREEPLGPGYGVVVLSRDALAPFSG